MDKPIPIPVGSRLAKGTICVYGSRAMLSPLRERTRSLGLEFGAARGDTSPPVHLGTFTARKADLGKLLFELTQFDRDNQDRPFCCTDAQGNILDLRQNLEELVDQLLGGSEVSWAHGRGSHPVDFRELKPLGPDVPGAHSAPVST